MVRSRSDAIDAIVSNVFRFALLFGFTTHVYDSGQRRLVHSRWAHCYSLTFHLISVLLLIVVYKLSSADIQFSQRKTHFFEALLGLYIALKLIGVFVALLSQWTIRSNVAMLLNDGIAIWQGVVTQLQESQEISRQSGRLFLLKMFTSLLVILNSVFGVCNSAVISFSVLQRVYLLVLVNIIMVVMMLFSSGLVFSLHIFRLLNFNLQQVVADVRNLRYTRAPRHSFRKRTVNLETKLGAIQQTHAQLQRWVVRFKDMYQVEVMLYLMSFFVQQVLTLFVLCVVICERWIDGMFSHLVAVNSTFVLCALDNTLLFYIAGQLLTACNGTGEILKDLPARRLLRTRLERCVEMLCLQLKCEKLRLSICGLVDLDWNNIFAMTEEAFLYIILLIQMDYENL